MTTTFSNVIMAQTDKTYLHTTNVITKENVVMKHSDERSTKLSDIGTVY